MKKENNNINFIFKIKNKKKVVLCLFIEAFLDFIYYVIPYTFALFLTLPFTVEKAIIVATIFISSKTVRENTTPIVTKNSNGYKVEKTLLMDMFPNTPHAETVVKLIKK